jgi:hypothetical protein
MNQAIYAIASKINVPDLRKGTEGILRTSFDTVEVGACFLRAGKSNNKVYMKFGKRNALLLADGKGNQAEVHKFKSTDKVIPLSMTLELRVPEMTEAGLALQDARVEGMSVRSSLTTAKGPRTPRLVLPVGAVLAVQGSKYEGVAG